MSTETENTNQVDRIIDEAWNNGHLDAIDELVAIWVRTEEQLPLAQPITLKQSAD